MSSFLRLRLIMLFMTVTTCSCLINNFLKRQIIRISKPLPYTTFHHHFFVPNMNAKLNTLNGSSSTSKTHAAQLSSLSSSSFPVEATIKDKLSSSLKPIHLEVRNESHMHNVPANSETHFKCIVVSEAFEGVKLMERHRLVNGILAEEIASEGPVHALSIVAKTPEQWNSMNANAIPPSPSCRGGDGSLPKRN